ncbi:hypothetical protein VW23_001035 [Devosia insulae DS-56]|uniref:Inactive Sirtuin domain-containing protein n=1 Tax=Devosia insulae DS-56 TaxID=1116389 RepID=A0A1E5XT22_9HYPH|nr:hypothetical protein [Devosia insulae]OEO31723.1 hypothetical protein VW23_001035 [Devosia insulae DS-56]
MKISALVRLNGVPVPLFSQLDTRDAALWVMNADLEPAQRGALADLMRLPWSVVLCEIVNSELNETLESTELIESVLVRRRGLVHLIDTNPSDYPLPPRSLPVFLLNGRPTTKLSAMAALTRRLTMLEELRRHPVKHLVIIGSPDQRALEELSGMWEDGFRPSISVVSDNPSESDIPSWIDRTGAPAVGVLELSLVEFSQQLADRFVADRDGSLVLRVRNSDGDLARFDVSSVDDPEHPILGRYELLADGALHPLMPGDLSAAEIESFFKDPSSSWRPFAAGMPWSRDDVAWRRVRNALAALDREGPESNKIFYVQAESGAGATTFVRNLAWTAAAQGYPTLVAGGAPFVPNGLEVTAFLGRLLDALAPQSEGEKATRLYQVPVLVVFDRTHWEGREDDLIAFGRELERSGRRACLLMVTGPYLAMAMVGNRRFTSIGELTHQITMEDAVQLGIHLNRYLLPHGAVRSEADWRRFFEASAVQASRGIAAFWIALSFWLQRQFDMQETVQSWMYRQFSRHISDAEVRDAIISIAALSTVRQSMPETLLPPTTDWPISHKLADVQRDLGSLGLIRISGEGVRYWSMIHDLLGRYILTALFYDTPAREAAGFADANSPEHLRFLALRRISKTPALQFTEFRDLADAFAVSIFKIDPDHGLGSFAPFWPDVLQALDEMPRSLRTTSRTFLHHTAISRRRIAKDPEMFPISVDERAKLLQRAVADIESALSFPGQSDADSDLSLFNSLAHAYHDLAEAESKRNADEALVSSLQIKARDVTRRAYGLNPDNSFVVETYARTLLSEATTSPELASEHAIEVLNIVYSTMARDSSETRRFALGRLADAALSLLMDIASAKKTRTDPETEPSAIVAALMALADGVDRFTGMELHDYPTQNRTRASDLLNVQLLRGNAQAVKLRYMLICIDQPYDFGMQLELLQSLKGAAAIFTPQMQLEFAVLLHQEDRHHEADRMFHDLRRLWRQGEHYVEVPNRLRWLLVKGTSTRRQVQATVSSGGDGRSAARVREFQGTTVLFRPQEFGQEKLRPGVSFRALVSFGHNGPFLRPLTAG